MRTGWHQRSMSTCSWRRGFMDREFCHRIAPERISMCAFVVITSNMGFLVNLFVSLMGSVWNVSQVKMNKDVVFPTTDDHSKWGVSDDQSNWICVGDINRAVIFLQNTFFVTIDSRIWMHSFLNSNTRSSAAAAPCARAHKSSLNATENWSARISHAVNSSNKTPTIEF